MSDALSAHLESDGQRWSDVHVRRVVGREAISQPFEFVLDVVAAAAAEPRDQGPNTELCLVFEVNGKELRRVHGMIATVAEGLETTGPWRSHRLTLVPRALRMSLVETQAVYLDASIAEVILAKGNNYGFADADLGLRVIEELPRREIMVQFAESDLAFVSRLAEHVGISYYFEQENGRDRLVFSDPAGFQYAPGYEQVGYEPGGAAHEVYRVGRTRTLVPKTFLIRDHNYRNPARKPAGRYVLDDADCCGGIVEYGPNVQTPEQAATLAQVRAEERRSAQTLLSGESTCIGFSAGRRTNLVDHPLLTGSDASLLLVEVEHEAVLPTPWHEESATRLYSNRFVAAPGTLDYRPPRRTPRPRMPSVVTGVIQPGPNGEVGGVPEIDGEGRYRVQMHFDGGAALRLASSHPMRLAQPFAGHGQGLHFPLRPGTEVLVAFANGDPDRPVILGALPNPTSRSPVVDSNSHFHRIVSPGGLTVEFGASIPK